MELFSIRKDSFSLVRSEMSFNSTAETSRYDAAYSLGGMVESPYVEQEKIG